MTAPLDGLPVSEACERNKGPILNVLEDVFELTENVLEIGSGTGQHGVYFAEHLPHLTWQCSEIEPQLSTLKLRVNAATPGLMPPAALLDVTSPIWPVEKVDAVFSANTAHIISWQKVEYLFTGVAGVLEVGGCFVLYGPFKYGGNHTSPTNVKFDAYLQAQDAERGIRDLSDLKSLGKRCGLRLEDDRPMPANNQILVWRRVPTESEAK